MTPSESSGIPAGEPKPHNPILPVVPDPPMPAGSFWQTNLGRALLWAGNILVITITFVAISWLAAKSGISIPLAPPIVNPPPVVVEGPTPVAAVESPTQFYCGRLEMIGDRETTRPWPVKKLTWTIQSSEFRGNLSQFQLREAFTVAWASWSAWIDIAPEYTENTSEALIVIRFGDIDGSGRVLAWSELADGTTTTKHQLYDRGERWEIAAAPTQIDIVRVAAHEIGHVLGLYHDQEDSGTLMAPVYSQKIRFPGERDAKRLMAMGYKPKPIPPGTGPTLPPLQITIDAAQIIRALEAAGYVIQKK